MGFAHNDIIRMIDSLSVFIFMLFILRTIPFRGVICYLSQSYYLYFQNIDWVLAGSYLIPGVVKVLVLAGCL